MLRYLKLIKKIEFNFNYENKDFLFLDEKVEKKINFISNKFSKKGIRIRDEKKDLFIILSTIFFFFFKKKKLFECYIYSYIKFYKPKLLISTTENIKFLNFKSFFNIPIIYLQVDYKEKSQINLIKKISKKIDYIYVTGSFFAEHFKKKVINPISIGLFTKKFKNFFSNDFGDDIIYISTYRDKKRYPKDFDYYNWHYRLDKFILEKIKLVAKKERKKIYIYQVYKINDKFNHENEKKYYKKNFYNLKLNFISEPEQLRFKNNALFVNTTSTLGYELISQGFKCIFFCLRRGEDLKFCHNTTDKSEGFFWTSRYNSLRAKEIIEKNLKINSRVFFLKANVYIKKLFYYNKNIYKELNSIIEKIVKS